MTLTQTERVLRLLRQRPSQGVSQYDVMGPVVADGGKPILRLAARIADLKRTGVNTTTSKDRSGVTVYRLALGAVLPCAPAPRVRRTASTPARRRAAITSAPARLFDDDATRTT